MNNKRQKSRAARQKRRVRQHRRSILGISVVILLLTAVMMMRSISLHEKNEAYIEQEAELQALLDEEYEWEEEIAEMEAYVGSDEYIEQIARDKLGLAYENEIIFRAK